MFESAPGLESKEYNQEKEKAQMCVFQSNTAFTDN